MIIHYLITERSRRWCRMMPKNLRGALNSIIFAACFVGKQLKFSLIILRRKFHLFVIDAGRESGILAITLVANRNLHGFERLFWFSILLGSLIGAIKLTRVQLNRYMMSPTVVSVDRNYRSWDGSLPAVTLCYYDHIDSFKANEYIQQRWNVSIVDEDYFYLMDFFYAVVNASANNYMDLARFAEDERFDDIDLMELIQTIDRPFEQLFTSFDPDFEIKVLPVMTERGACYAINSPFSALLTTNSLQYKDLEEPLACQYGRQQCYIKMDLYESTGTVDVHSPFEVSATDATVLPLHKSDEITASYKVAETVASKNLRDLSVDQRKCVFHDEETSSLKIYSKSLCLVRCRAIMALEMCNCVPFFYPFVDGPRCAPSGFECLLDFKWPVWALHICKCPNTCTEISYSVQTIKKSSWGVKSNDDNIKADTVASSFRWDLIPPKVRMRRDVVFSFEDFLVSFGGALALFLGLNILSMIQVACALIFHLIINAIELILYIFKLINTLLQHYVTTTGQSEEKSRKDEQKKKFSLDLCKRRKARLVAIHQKSSEEQFNINQNNNENDCNLKGNFQSASFWSDCRSDGTKIMNQNLNVNL